MTTYNWMPYDPADGCTPHSAGAKALAAYLEDRFPYQYSGGICNCRNVNGGSTWSHHAECRAYDCMIPTDGGAYIPAHGDPIIELLGPHGFRLGLDHFILNRIIYSATSPDGRYYSGRHPHYNHAHIGLNTLGATNLTYATLVAVLGDPNDTGDNDMLPPSWAEDATQWHIDRNIYGESNVSDVDESEEFHRQTVFRHRFYNSIKGEFGGDSGGPHAHPIAAGQTGVAG